ncbi:hypothetical protein IIU_05068 [Bacillus cereus VD133]|uniref:Phage protein n=1 Tax=Bacillus cereus VD133 TaxID=1053233 RepID=A0A9W5PN26_BACCE|nr:hypothetical protein [Bacillus cereus]EOO30751.1 hypothetical protein IIU_05068 [Bacillus cereus VD133]
MSNLRVIDGITKEKPDYFEIYHRMFANAILEMKEENATGTCSRDVYKKVVFSGVRFINQTAESQGYGHAQVRFLLICKINEIMKHITPREFMTIFPIAKEYKGKKYGMKDYFSTMRSMKGMGMDTPIGENVREFLWSYHNWEDITEFVVNFMEVISEIRRYEGGKGLVEELLEEKGITAYTLCKDSNGKEYLANSDTGEVTPIRKARPRYLKPIN